MEKLDHRPLSAMSYKEWEEKESMEELECIEKC